MFQIRVGWIALILITGKISFVGSVGSSVGHDHVFGKHANALLVVATLVRSLLFSCALFLSKRVPCLLPVTRKLFGYSQGLSAADTVQFGIVSGYLPERF